MNKLTALLNLFRRGSMVADPAKWKRRQIEVTAVAALIVALFQVLGAFGYDLPMDPDTATAIAVGVIGIVNWVLTVTTTEKIGLPPVGDVPTIQPPGPDHTDQPDPRA
jgi:hypothetical protein